LTGEKKGIFAYLATELAICEPIEVLLPEELELVTHLTVYDGVVRRPELLQLHPLAADLALHAGKLLVGVGILRVDGGPFRHQVGDVRLELQARRRESWSRL
jgi:hypothetical protein